jgi:hypothetical protein
VGCALIAAMPEFQWVAVKITPHLHGSPDALKEETELESPKDTGRYLRAGAIGSYLASVLQTVGARKDLFREISLRVPETCAWMVESGGIETGIVAEIAGPVVSLAVLSGDSAEWKSSLVSRLASIDALVLTEGLLTEQLSPQFCGSQSFRLPEGKWVTSELLEFLRGRLLV